MYECIICGNVALSGDVCKLCDGAMITPISYEGAREEYINKLKHHGIELSTDDVDRMVKALSLED